MPALSGMLRPQENVYVEHLRNGTVPVATSIALYGQDHKLMPREVREIGGGKGVRLARGQPRFALWHPRWFP